MFFKYKLQKSREGCEDVSSEIVVVHEKGVPKLHGILKQRTVSESSDDGVHGSLSGCDRQVSTTTGSEGDDHDNSPDGSTVSAVGCGRRLLKKSVSFNDRVDHTLFQASQSVSSMHAALKNRRRRARKRDQKQEQKEQQKEQRRRRRSSGSFSLEESGDEQTTDVRDAPHDHTNKDGENSHISTESSADTKDYCSSPNVSCDKADCSYSNTISNGTQITNEKAFWSQDMLGSEPSSGNGDVHENKSTQSALQEGRLVSVEIRNESYNFSDTFRTKNCLVNCDLGIVNNDPVKPADACDNTSSVPVFDNDEKLGSDVSGVDANDVSLVNGNTSQSEASCQPDSAVELLKSTKNNDSSAVSNAGSKSQSSEKIAVLTMCCELELDVD